MKNYKAEITKIIQDQDMGYTMSRFDPETVDKILSLIREIAKEAVGNYDPLKNDLYDERTFGRNELRSEILSNEEKLIGGKND